MATSPDGGYGWVSPLIGGLSGYFGSRGATNAQVAGNNAAIGTEQNLIPTLEGLYGSQRNAGNGAFGQLVSTLGLNGGAPNYAGFENSPGYKFAVQQGEQAIDRQAAAGGNLYTPNTMNAVGGYVTGLASQNYNNYVDQLLRTAGYGAQGNASLGQDLYGIGANIAQTQSASGNARAVGSAGAATGVGSAAASLPWGKIISGLGSWFSPSTNNSGVSGGSDGSNVDPYAGFDTSGLGTLDYSGGYSPSTDTSLDFNNMNSGFNSSDPNSGF